VCSQAHGHCADITVGNGSRSPLAGGDGEIGPRSPLHSDRGVEPVEAMRLVLNLETDRTAHQRGFAKCCAAIEHCVTDDPVVGRNPEVWHTLSGVGVYDAHPERRWRKGYGLRKDRRGNKQQDHE
jgi:hypothetical protein